MKKILFIAISVLVFSVSAEAFTDGACEADCKKCHTLTTKEADSILKSLNMKNSKILDIRLSPVKSLWEVSLEDNGNRGLLYVDFSKKFIVSGQIVELATKQNKTETSLYRIEKKVDVSKIKLNQNLVIGNKNAKKKVIIFTDPDCSFCAKLHDEIKKAAKQRNDLVFYIKLYPLEFHKDAYWKSKSIVCTNSLDLLEDNFSGKQIKKADCKTSEVDDNIKTAKALGITATPAIILPDGKLHMGLLSADKLIERIFGGK
ncbi:MAG: DsbC family protein [Nitrospiraceae bacterium]|nr:DsbC family protein [Nitrospiraceae bacterium]